MQNCIGENRDYNKNPEQNFTQDLIFETSLNFS